MVSWAVNQSKLNRVFVNDLQKKGNCRKMFNLEKTNKHLLKFSFIKNQTK